MASEALYLKPGGLPSPPPHLMNIVIFVACVGNCGSKAFAKGTGFKHEPFATDPKPEKLDLEIRSRPLWGGVSHFWKDRLSGLQQRFPDAYIFHLVRDGRKNVNSYQVSNFYSENYKHDYHIRPLPIEGFEKMTRFEKLCWYWRYWNEEIEKYATKRIRLEDVQDLLTKENASGEKPKWSQEEWDTFERICGDLNRKYGY